MEIIDIVPVIVGVIAAVGVIYSIFRGVQESKFDRLERNRENNIEFSKMLEGYRKDFDGITRRFEPAKSFEEYDSIARNYINTCERMAYLKKLGRIENELIEFFDDEFALALTFLDWRKQVYTPQNDPSRYYPEFLEWTRKRGIKSLALNVLIEEMFKFIDLKKKEFSKISESSGKGPKDFDDSAPPSPPAPSSGF